MLYFNNPQQQRPPVVPFTQDITDTPVMNELPSVGLYDNDSDPNDPNEIMRRNTEVQHAIAQGMGLSENDPNHPDAPLPAKYLDMVNKLKSVVSPGPLEQDYKAQLQSAYDQAKNHPEHGLKARLAGLGRGLLMGEGIPGMVKGAADPTNMHLRYRLAQLNPLEHGAQLEQGFKQAELGRANILGNLTGYDPFTGVRTPMAAYRDYLSMAGMGRLGQGQQRIDVIKQRADDYHKWMVSRQLDMAGKPRLERQREIIKLLPNLTTQEGLDWAASELNIPHLLMPAFKSGEMGINEAGQFFSKRTGKVLNDPETNLPIFAFEKTKEQDKIEIADKDRGVRQEGVTVQKGKLEVEKHAEGRLTGKESRESEAAIRKQVQSEIPRPRFASPNSPEMQEWKTKIDEEVKKRAGANTGGDYARANQYLKKSLPEGAVVIETGRSKADGKPIYKIRLKDGTIQYLK